MIAQGHAFLNFSGMIKIKTFIYDGEPNAVNKTLQENEEYTGVLNATFNVLTPVVRFRTHTPVSFNYVFIESLNRYYFVSELNQDGDICTVRLRVDVLQTYKEKILTATGRIAESNHPDPYISNRETVYKRTPNFEKVPFTETGLLNEDGSIIMITLKGTTED